MITIVVNGQPISVTRGANLAAILLLQKIPSRIDIVGSMRAPFCGMGVCGECRVLVNDVSHTLACRVACDDGMKVETMR